LWPAALATLRLARRQVHHLRDQSNLLGAVSRQLVVALPTMHLSAG
jgi:hypothetical protein